MRKRRVVPRESGETGIGQQRSRKAGVSHAQAAARLGAGEEEVAEAIGVTVLMGGGPATVQGPRAFAAFRELASEQPAACAPVAHPSTEPVPVDDAAPPRDLARLLHDLDVANDYHPDHPRRPVPDPGTG